MSTKSPSLKERLTPPLWLLTVLILGLVAWFLWELKELVSLVVVGYSLAYVIQGPLSRLEKWRVPRSLGFFVLLLGLILAVGLLALTAFPTISREYNVLSQNLPQYVSEAKSRMVTLVQKFNIPLEAGTIESILQSLPTPSGETVRGAVAGLGNALISGYSITLTLLNLALLPFIVFYLAVDWRGIHQAILNLWSGATRKKISSISAEIDGYVAAFIRGQLTIGCILVVLYAIGLGAIVGIDLWLLIAVIAGLGNLIPYFGLIAGVLLGSIMALVTFGDLPHLVYTWAVFAVVQFITDTFIAPRVVGESVGLSPLVVILALFAGGQLFGFLGLVLAIPATAALRVVALHSHARLAKG